MPTRSNASGGLQQSVPPSHIGHHHIGIRTTEADQANVEAMMMPRSSVGNCNAAAIRARVPELWRWADLTSVEMKTKGVYGKTWFLDFFGGVRHGGARTVLKLRKYWAPLNGGIMASDVQSVQQRVLLNAGFTCSYRNQSETTLGFGTGPVGILNELLVYVPSRHRLMTIRMLISFQYFYLFLSCDTESEGCFCFS